MAVLEEPPDAHDPGHLRQPVELVRGLRAFQGGSRDDPVDALVPPGEREKPLGLLPPVVGVSLDEHVAAVPGVAGNRRSCGQASGGQPADTDLRGVPGVQMGIDNQGTPILSKRFA